MICFDSYVLDAQTQKQQLFERVMNYFHRNPRPAFYAQIAEDLGVEPNAVAHAVNRNRKTFAIDDSCKTRKRKLGLLCYPVPSIALHIPGWAWEEPSCKAS